MTTVKGSPFRNRSTWERGLFILLFALLYAVAEVVLWAVILFQFGSRLVSGHSNDALLEFSRGLNAYFYQILQFISFRSDFRPYPFSDWPGEGLTREELEPVDSEPGTPVPLSEDDDNRQA